MPGPRFLMGDLNLPNLVVGATGGAFGRRRMARVPTYPVTRPRFQFDYILSGQRGPGHRVGEVHAQATAVVDDRALVVALDDRLCPMRPGGKGRAGCAAAAVAVIAVAWPAPAPAADAVCTVRTRGRWSCPAWSRPLRLCRDQRQPVRPGPTSGSFTWTSACRVTKAHLLPHRRPRPRGPRRAPDGTLWSADIGDNLTSDVHRETIALWRYCPKGGGEPVIYRLTYPDGSARRGGAALHRRRHPADHHQGARRPAELYEPTGPLKPARPQACR